MQEGADIGKSYMQVKDFNNKVHPSSLLLSSKLSVEKIPKVAIERATTAMIPPDIVPEHSRCYWELLQECMRCLHLYDPVGITVKASERTDHAYERGGLCKDIPGLLESARTGSIKLK